jgi:uncharacterized membrane protein
VAFCKSCGQDIGTANFCPKCGASQSAGAAPAAQAAPQATAPVSPSSEGLAENVAGLLCYAVGWVTGLIFLLIDKRPWVKFHAAQSIAVFGGLTILRIGLLFMSHFVGWGIQALLGLIGFVLWIFLMIKAYQHETVRIPIAADIADSLAK